MTQSVPSVALAWSCHHLKQRKVPFEHMWMGTRRLISPFTAATLAPLSVVKGAFKLHSGPGAGARGALLTISSQKGNCGIDHFAEGG